MCFDNPHLQRAHDQYFILDATSHETVAKSSHNHSVYHTSLYMLRSKSKSSNKTGPRYCGLCWYRDRQVSLHRSFLATRPCPK